MGGGVSCWPGLTDCRNTSGLMWNPWPSGPPSPVPHRVVETPSLILP